MCHGDMHFGNILVKHNGFITLIDFGICNYDIKNENIQEIIILHKNEVLYNYREFLLKQTVHSIDTLLSCVIKMPNNISENYINLITSNFISYIQHFSKDISKVMYTDMYYMDLIFNFANDYNLQINGEAVYIIMQLVILDSFSYYIPGTLNGMVSMRTMSYMKREPFFMDEMSDFILKFYKLEYQHENEEVRNKYP